VLVDAGRRAWTRAHLASGRGKNRVATVGAFMGAGVASETRMGRVVTFAWAALPFAVATFIWLRTIPNATALFASQMLLLAPIAGTALAAEVAHAHGPKGIERRAWGLLSIAAVVLLLSYAYYGWYQLTISPAGPGSPSVFDVLNAVAAATIMLAIVQLAGLPRLGWHERLRLALDVTALSAVTFAELYHFAIRPLAGSASWWESARWTAYSLVGVSVVAGVCYLVGSARPGFERRLMSLVAVGVGVSAAGMALWPVWRSSNAVGGDSLLGGGVGVVYLLGDYLLMMAALTRIREHDQTWRITNKRLVNTAGPRVSTLFSLYVLLGVVLLGSWLYAAHGVSSPDARLYIACGLVATLGLVARTSVTTIQTVLARTAANIDPVTGALGSASFLCRCDDAIARAEHLGEQISLIVFDLDGFSGVNAALGRAGGDRVLADVARLAAQTAGERGEVFRLAADKFTLICRMGEPDAIALATEVLAAVRSLTVADGTRLSASVGVVGSEAGECGRDEFVHRANAAQAWAKYHGKGRVVRFDERIVRALGVEERLRVQEDRSGLTIARALASAADARDPRNYYHSRNVAALSVMFSEALDLEPEYVRRIEIAAMLHDCGKLGLIDPLLADVVLTSRQRMASREHAVLGETFVRSVGIPDMPVWVRHHHERWDGAGYPDGLAGEQIPLESRIIALADAYDTMTSKVRNRAPVSRGAALQEIDLGMGSRFDPVLAERFIEVVGRTASLGWSDEWAIA
jgi:diguanylate cyclase (GGDEF)-like protein